MNSSKQRCVILGVTGGIAVYKSADLCSKLKKNQYDVVPVMTQNACKLISPRIFFTLSGNPAITDLFTVSDWKPEHVSLAERGDLLVIAPCTANCIGKLAHGIADDALTTTAVSFLPEKILLVPAMNTQMWNNPAVRDNCEILRNRGFHFVGPASGILACGTSGEGRMSEVTEIICAINDLLK